MDCFRDWFRTLLSLLGVCVGVFSIVSVFTLVDSLQATIREGFENFGTDMVFVEKEPLEPDLNEDGVFRWWEYASRPDVSYEEYQYLRRQKAVATAAFSSSIGSVTAVDGDWETVASVPVSSGRPFNDTDLQKGAPVVLLGQDAVREFFDEGTDPVGNTIHLLGRSYSVVGVFARRGANSVSLVDIDNLKMIPYRSASGLANTGVSHNTITLSPEPGQSQDGFISSIRLAMRQYRRLSPEAEDNFAVNRISFVIDQMTEIFSMVSTLGWIIGLFSLLAGGFGIANIMFVSVHERTREIGIEKALGAHRSRILFNFLEESLLMSLMGGAAGILLVWCGTQMVPVSSIRLELSPDNVGLGLTVSAVIGLISGMAPAIKAASLSPAVAISRKM